MLRYLYCAIPAGSRPDLSGWNGEGAPLEIIETQGVAGVLGQVRAEKYGARALAQATSDVRRVAAYAVAHQAVVQYVFDRVTAAVPMAFASVHRTRSAALRALGAEAPRLRRLLRKLAGMQEWGLRVAWRPAAARIDLGIPGAGTAYLEARGKALRARAPDAAALGAAERLAGQLARAAAAHRAHDTTPDGDLVLRASFLILAARAARLRTLLLRQADMLERHGLVAELSGPWPAYSFSDR